jgi:hypothetical protein
MSDYVTNADLVNAIGILAVSLYLGSCAALHTGFLRGQGYVYPAINMAAVHYHQNSLYVAKTLAGLFCDVAFTDNLLVLVPCHLPGEVDHSSFGLHDTLAEPAFARRPDAVCINCGFHCLLPSSS